MSKLLKVILYTLGAWIIALGLVLILPVPVVSGFAPHLSLLIGFGLLLLALISLVKDRDKLSSVLAILLIAVTTWLAVTKSLDWGAWIHFRLNRDKYEAELAKVLSGSDEAERQRICGEDCLILSDNADRVAFHYVHGFLAWFDIVYDPTGAVMERDWDKKKRINTYLIRAKHLSGDWYLVHFGD